MSNKSLLLIQNSGILQITNQKPSTSLSAVAPMAMGAEEETSSSFSTSTSTSTSTIYFLIGFMGSGKSLLSRGVKQSLDVITIEMDEEIEKLAGCTINDIFSREGEQGFRIREQEVLMKIIEDYRTSDKLVLVSTGGGAPCHFDNMELMKRTGTTIFINPSADRLSHRLMQKKEERPLIKDLSFRELKTYVQNTVTKRLPYYSQASIMVNMIHDDKAMNIEFLKDIILAD